MASAKRRSIFADRLSAFADFVSGDDAAFVRSGRWRDFFRSRIGAPFDGRVIVEIGCSNAATLSTMATKHPSSGFVGIDWKAKQIFLGAQQILERRHPNIALLHARAQDLRQIFHEGEVDEILIFHPEPSETGKASQSELITATFMLSAHSILRDHLGTLSLKTDHVAYYQRMLGLFGLLEPDWSASAASTGVRLVDLLPSEEVPSVSDDLCRSFEALIYSRDFWHDPAALAHVAARPFNGEVTLFEQRFIRRRQPIFYFELRKK